MALSFERMPNYALDNADIVREAMLRQLSEPADKVNGRAATA